MNIKLTSDIFTYIKKHSGGAIPAKIRKIKTTMIKYLSHTKHVQFSLHCNHINILPDLCLKSRIKSKRSKTILKYAAKLLLQERIHINHAIRDKLKNSIRQFKHQL